MSLATAMMHLGVFVRPVPAIPTPSMTLIPPVFFRSARRLLTGTRTLLGILLLNAPSRMVLTGLRSTRPLVIAADVRPPGMFVAPVSTIVLIGPRGGHQDHQGRAHRQAHGESVCLPNAAHLLPLLPLTEFFQ
jgi:hypothetical protein